ncbi:hypothetical protein V6N13_059037 [Hibiscus sabdariffa]
MKSRNEKSGLQPDQLTGRKSDSRFESLSEALLESDVTDPVLPETVVFEPIMSSEVRVDDSGRHGRFHGGGFWFADGSGGFSTECSCLCGFGF